MPRNDSFFLHYRLADAVKFKSHSYPANYAFDNVLRFIDLMEDEEVGRMEKIEWGIELILGELPPLSFEDTMELFGVVWEALFEKGGQEPPVDVNGNPMPAPKAKPVYSLSHDAEFIYASFVQAYGIDLFQCQGQLHWQKFKALLHGLPENTKFRQVIDIRTRKMPTGKGAQEERKNLKDLKELYALPEEV